MLQLFDDNCHLGADLDVHGAFLHEYPGKVSVILTLEAHGGLVGLHLEQDVPSRDLVTYLLAPLHQVALTINLLPSP